MKTSALPVELVEAITAVGPRLGSIASKLLFFPTVGSTNDVALSIADEGAVVVAEEQTAGRGRRGHSWSSPGGGLYVSVVLAPARAHDARRATTLLTLMMGLAIGEGIEAATGLRADLKWPNDLLIGGRKLAGILAEASIASGAVDRVVAGYGINVAPIAGPELRNRATALESELGRAIDRYQVLAETLAAIAARYRDLLDGRFDAILDGWRRRAPAADGARVEWNGVGGPQAGVTAGIDSDGALLVRTSDRVERIVAGEIRWVHAVSH